MGRKISTGKIGRSILGNLVAIDNELQTIQPNSDLKLIPNGDGIVSLDSDLQFENRSKLRLGDSDSSSFIELQSPSSLISNITLTFPGGLGSAGNVITTDGNGVLSFSALEFDVNNQNSDTSTYYPLMSTADSGSIGELSVSNAKLSFKPNTGTLSVNELTANSASINGSFTADSITESSSIKLKENIKSLGSVSDKIKELNPVTYQRISTNATEVGLIAEDVYKVIPELVKLDKNGDPESIYYTKLGAYMVEAFKELQNQFENFKNG